MFSPAGRTLFERRPAEAAGSEVNKGAITATWSSVVCRVFSSSLGFVVLKAAQVTTHLHAGTPWTSRDGTSSGASCSRPHLDKLRRVRLTKTLQSQTKTHFKAGET